MWYPQTGGIQVEKFNRRTTATLTEANSMLISKDQSTSSDRIISSDSMRNAVELLLKAAGYLELLIQDVLVHLPPDIRSRLPKDLHEGTLEAISLEALAQSENGLAKKEVADLIRRKQSY